MTHSTFNFPVVNTSIDHIRTLVNYLPDYLSRLGNRFAINFLCLMSGELNKVKVAWRDIVPLQRHRSIIAVLVSLSVTGCAGVADLRSVDAFSQSYSVGDYATAVTSVGGETGLDYKEDNLLLALNVGSAQFADGQFEQSTVSFERAENQLSWKADKVDSVEEVGRAMGTFLTSDLAAKYTGNIYEGTLINTYKALNAIHRGDLAGARVEFNRADVRQDNAVHQLAAKVAKINSKNANNGNAQDNKNAATKQRYSKEIDSGVGDAIKPDTDLGKRLAAVNSFKKYKGLRNPLTDYLHGIFRLVTGEPNKASDLLRNAAVLTDENPYIIGDLKLAEKVASQADGTIAPRVWVIYEDGIGPDLAEFRIDLPTGLVSSNLLYAGVAVPEFVPGKATNGNLKITVSGEQIATQAVLDTDSLVATEFATTYDRVVTKAITSALVKAIVAHEVNKQMEGQGWIGLITKVATTVAQVASTQADTRIWRALPHTVGVASIPYPQDGIIALHAGAGQTQEINLNDYGYGGKHVMITAKAVTDGLLNWHVVSL